MSRFVDWKGNLIDAEKVECVKFQTHYSDVYDVAYGDGTDCAYIFIKNRNGALIFQCTENEFEELKTMIKETP